MSLLSLAGFGVDQGRFEEALGRCQAAIEAFEDIGEVWSAAWARCSLGRVLTGSNRPDEAVPEYRQALSVFEERDDSDSRAVALIGLGEALDALGDAARAREVLTTALEYLRDHGDPRAEGVQARLSRLPGG